MTSTTRRIPPLHRGTLAPYHVHYSRHGRRSALGRAIRRIQRRKRLSERSAAMMARRKLLAVATFTKNTRPAQSRRMRADAAWIVSKYIK